MSGYAYLGVTDASISPRRLPSASDAPSDTSAAANARGLRRIYARRIEALKGRLADEVAWNILLDLVVSEAEGRSPSMTALALGARAPLTTVLRYVALLRRAGYVVRIADVGDRRRSFVRLTPFGRKVADGLLSVDRAANPAST